MDELARIENIVSQIRKVTNFVPKIGIVLGSGLSDFANDIRVIGKIPYSKLNGFPVSTAPGHNGQFIFGYIEKTPVILMDGRIHYYEGYPMNDVVLPQRIMARLGAKIVLLTNAAGGINKNYYEGALIAITDHISSFVPSPLIGPNIDELGTRFPDMSNVYDYELKELLIKTARSLSIPMREGVYLQTTGPNYETPAEINFFKTIGADAVGMSTAVEAIALNHMGVRVCGISCITNMAAGISKNKLSHDEVKKNADAVAEKFKPLVWHFVLNAAALLKEEKESKKDLSKITPSKKNIVDDFNIDDFEIIEIK